MAKVELKQPVVQEISENVKDAQSVVVVDYRGLTVAEDTQLRRELREAGVTYKVYKNTMMNFAFKDTDFESLTDVLEGPSAIAISKEDATAPARVLAKKSLQFHQEKSYYPSYLEVSSHLSPTSLVFLSKSLRTEEQLMQAQMMLRQRLQLRKLKKRLR